ncbi:MAG: ParA family protein [Cyanobacteria bacterium J06629_9]
MVRILAVFNQAGGVGKTTVTMNVGYHLAEAGKRVLLIDMDPQASLTTFMGLNPDTETQTVYNALVDGVPLPIRCGLHSMDIAPANENLSAAEKMLSDEILKELTLKNTLEFVKANYDFILLDCPPSLGFLSIASLLAASHILIPIETEYKALEGTRQLIKTIQKVRKGNGALKIAGIIPTIYDARLTQEKRNLKKIEDTFKAAIVFPPIPDRTDFANASQAHVPLALYAPNNQAIPVLQKIATTLGKL